MGALPVTSLGSMPFLVIQPITLAGIIVGGFQGARPWKSDTKGLPAEMKNEC